MPYRLDLFRPADEAFELLVELGALDIEPVPGGLAAIFPDSVSPDRVAAQFGSAGVTFSPAVARDAGSVWMLSPPAVIVGGRALLLADSDAFGTGHHPSTALCLEALEEIVGMERPACILDVGTGSGILALAALLLGVPRATGLDLDPSALAIAAENARLNQLAGRLELVLGGPETVTGAWPVVIANVLAFPLIEMAPVLVQRLGTRGRLILSGIHSSLESEVRRAYQHCGIGRFDAKTRAGWTALTAQAPW